MQVCSGSSLVWWQVPDFGTTCLTKSAWETRSLHTCTYYWQHCLAILIKYPEVFAFTLCSKIFKLASSNLTWFLDEYFYVDADWNSLQEWYSLFTDMDNSCTKELMWAKISPFCLREYSLNYSLIVDIYSFPISHLFGHQVITDVSLPTQGSSVFTNCVTVLGSNIASRLLAKLH